MSTVEVWKGRTSRLYVRTLRANEDLKRSFSWHILGGKVFFERYLTEILSSHKWYFIVACNNSGTSLLQNILEYTGQVSTMEHEGQRYTRTLVRATKKGYERVWSEYLDELRMTGKDPLQILPRLVHDWMEELIPPVKNTIVEKTTANAVRMQWLQKAFPNSSFIGMVRNGYAVVEGIRRKGDKSIERGARHWNRVNKIMRDDANKIDNYFQLKYEDLVERSEDKIAKLAGFINLDQECITQAMDKTYGFSTIRGQGRQGVTNFNKESIDRLSKDDRSIIDGLASEMLDYYGYKRK